MISEPANSPPGPPPTTAITAGQPLEITEQDGRLEIVPAATPMRLADAHAAIESYSVLTRLPPLTTAPDALRVATFSVPDPDRCLL